MIKKIYNSFIQKYRIWIFITSLVIFFVILSLDIWYNVDSFSIWNYIQGATTEFLGIVFTVLVVDFLYFRAQSNKDKSTEKNRIKNLDVILKISMKKTLYATLQLYNNNLLETKKFDISMYKYKDLKNAFEGNRLMNEGIFNKSYQIYYKNHKILLDKIERIFTEQEFEYNKTYTNLLESFLKDSLFDYENEKGIDVIANNKKFLNLLNSDKCPELKQSNLGNYLVFLYKSSQRFYKFYSEYNDLISKI